LTPDVREDICGLPLPSMVARVAELVFGFLEAEHLPIAPVSKRMFMFFSGKRIKCEKE